MARLAAVAVWVLASCAHEAPASRHVVAAGVRSFSGLQGRPVSVVLVDVDGRFAASASLLSAARDAIIEQLRASNVMVVDDAPSRLVFETSGAPPPDAASTQQCVRVSGRLEAVAQAFLPGQTAVVTRCGGRGPGAANADALGAVVSAGAQAVRAASGGPERDLAEALFWGVDDVLTQLDSMLRR